MSSLRHVSFTFACVLTLHLSNVRAATTNFFESFERALNPAWAVGDANSFGRKAHWGIVGRAFGGEAPHSGKRKLYCAGVGRVGRPGAPRYRDQMSAYLQRTVDLTDYRNAVLSFWFKMPSIENDYDGLSVSVDGSTLWSCNTNISSWTQVMLPLTDFAGAAHVLKFEFESDQNITFEGCYLDDILVVSGSLNDSFSNASVLRGGTGSITNHNADATAEAFEPDPGNSIWFRWLARTNGTVTFNAEGSGFATLLCVYEGTNLTELTPIGCVESGGSVTFDAASGAIYHISVRGISNAEGVVVLTWDQPNGHARDLLPDLSVWADAARRYLYGWYLDRSEQPGRVLLRASTATPNMGEGQLELRGSSTQPGVYQRIYRDDGTSWDRYAGTFTFHPGHQHLHYDDWMNFHLRTVLTNDGVGDIVASGDKISFAIIDLVQYDALLPGSPTSPKFSGGLVQGLSVGWADVYGANLADQWIDITDIPLGRYWLEAVVDPKNNIMESNESNNVARILIDLGAVTNAPAPREQPLSTNVAAGSSATFSVTNAGTFFQWRHNGTNLANDAYHDGVDSPVLKLTKVKWTDSGAYSVLISNVFGAITTAPGNLIVVDHARVVYVPEINGASEASVTVPVWMQSVGNEHSVSFSLTYDPAVLSNPRVTHLPTVATCTVDSSLSAAGIIGVSIALPANVFFRAGDALVAQFTFDTSAVGDVKTFAGFENVPIPRAVLGAKGVALESVFVAGEIDLTPPGAPVSTEHHGAVTR